MADIEHQQESQEILKQVVKQFGKQIFDKSESSRLEGLLSDFLAYDKGKQRLFRLAVKDGIVHDLLQCDSLEKSEKTIKTNLLKAKFKEDNFLEENIAYHVVDCFTYALGWEKKTATKKTKSEKIIPQKTEPELKKEEPSKKEIKKKEVKKDRNESVLKIRSNISCSVFVNGEFKIKAYANRTAKLQLKKDSYELEFVSLGNSDVRCSELYMIEDEEEIINVDLENILQDYIQSKPGKIQQFFVWVIIIVLSLGVVFILRFYEIIKFSLALTCIGMFTMFGLRLLSQRIGLLPND